MVAQFQDGYPISCTAPTVDAGCAVDSSDGLSFDGTPRVKNGRIDIGCFEYDWREDYSRKLSKSHRFAVTSAPPTCVEVDAGVLLLDGTLKTAWSADRPSSRAVTAQVTGGGTLRVLRDGVVVYTGKVASLKRLKDDAKEVVRNFECGIGLENFHDIKIGDTIEAFDMVEEAATLD